MKQTILKAIEVALNLCHMVNNTSAVVPVSVFEDLLSAYRTIEASKSIPGDSEAE